MSEDVAQRLQKIIAEAGIASRRAAERLILAGRVKVNGEVVKTLGAKAQLGKDTITVDNQELKSQEALSYYMFHKPEGYLTALKDAKLKRPTIAEFLKRLPIRVYPVGRLDKDVSGFLVLTNDGELARRLMHPSFEVPKVYHALVKGFPSRSALRMLESGELIIDGKPAAPARARMLTKGPDKGFLELIISEGRHRQVKRMCAQVGHPVEKLKRVAYSDLVLDIDLPPGKFRRLTSREVDLLKRRVGLL
ncbi:MAG: rRNA pseudouridine synthase [Deltaproteobacteria bacterium]|jgi:23S rRNA pseudouridine2605 synthase|nr:rRNA pseudouridine synthase [Deltaproteobacteria bacterium]